MNATDRLNRDMERLYVANRQIDVTHFYSIGDYGNCKLFAFGYATPDGVFHTGIVAWDGERFTGERAMIPWGN